jgi:hypothetical protein
MCNQNNQANRTSSANVKSNRHNVKNVKSSFEINVCGEQVLDGTMVVSLPDNKILKLSFDGFKSSGNVKIEFEGWAHMNSNR